MTVETSRSGRYDRKYLVGGTLQATPMRPTSPPRSTRPATPSMPSFFEAHRGTLTDRRGQVTERAAQVLLGDPRQSLSWRFSAGHADHFARKILCGID